MTAVDEIVTPIDRYLAEQQDATAVERFSRRHDHDLLDPDARWYADRLPTARPEVGEQYAFRVDLDQCTGCKACVSACHSLNGLDEGESWRSVGQLVDPTGREPAQTVPTGCHHCVDPACLSGCPTNAYEKDPVTGIVRHLDDQCFGCGYCELTCPYEVPKLNKRLGVVRKCDLCTDRLAEGEAPACVQACPTSAITIDVVDVQEVVAETRTGSLVPGAPASSITAPTTRYVGTRSLPESARGADHHALHPSESHPPLAFMLVMTQLSVGGHLAALATGTFRALVVATVAGVVAMAGSIFHLGRPLAAWRAVLGIGHSWLSREIVAFGAYAALATGSLLLPPLGPAAAVAGVAGVACSGMIYVVTGRTWWAARFTMGKFVTTTAGLGPLVVAAFGGEVAVTAGLGAASLGVGLAAELALLLSDRWPPESDLGRTRRLLRGPLAAATLWRVALGTLAVALAGGAALGGEPLVAAPALVPALAAALVERYQFFVASVAPRMPGGFR